MIGGVNQLNVFSYLIDFKCFNFASNESSVKTRKLTFAGLLLLKEKNTNKLSVRKEYRLSKLEYNVEIKNRLTKARNRFTTLARVKITSSSH